MHCTLMVNGKTGRKEDHLCTLDEFGLKAVTLLN